MMNKIGGGGGARVVYASKHIHDVHLGRSRRAELEGP